MLATRRVSEVSAACKGHLTPRASLASSTQPSSTQVMWPDATLEPRAAAVRMRMRVRVTGQSGTLGPAHRGSRLDGGQRGRHPLWHGIRLARLAISGGA